MRRTTAGALITVFAGFLMIASASANDRWGDRPSAYSQGYNNGYRDGFERGRFDSFRGHFGAQGRGFRYDERGYYKPMGPKGQYKKGYREGFEAGYRDSYHRRVRPPWVHPFYPYYRR